MESHNLSNTILNHPRQKEIHSPPFCQTNILKNQHFETELTFVTWKVSTGTGTGTTVIWEVSTGTTVIWKVSTGTTTCAGPT